MTPSETLSQPLLLPCGVRIGNRLAKSAMSERLGTRDNAPTELLARLYRTWAEGGLGLAITGNVMIDKRARGEPNNVVLEAESDLAPYQAWAEAGTTSTCQVWMQLNHPGKQAPKFLNEETVAPSAIPLGPELSKLFPTPRTLTEPEIEALVVRFGVSAGLAKKAGFAGVQIHGAHGYLVSQFLSPRHNQRQDGWGGTPAHRRRFVLAVVAEIRRQVGSGFPVGIKLNSADFQRGGFTEEESLETIAALASAGVDLIEISGGTYESAAMVKPKKASTQAREAYFLEFAEKARATVTVPLMLTGGFRSLGGMAQAVASGAVDLVGMARPLAVEPKLPRRLLSGQEPEYPVGPLSTGLAAVDKMAALEINYYTRQLQRIGQGKAPKPQESALSSLCWGMVELGWDFFRSARLRAG